MLARLSAFMHRMQPSCSQAVTESGTLDLIMVAQALHWFDPPRFYRAQRS
jgi:hypothetical protein